nr:MAG TPA: hypothetical protein [Caudoviricetes sp.]
MAALDEKKKLLSDGTQSPSVQASAPSVQSASPATNLTGVSESTLGNLGKYTQGYKPSEAVSNAQSYLTGILNNKPGAYNSAYQNDLQGLYDRIMNREKFTYDLNGDALYNQYKQQYQQMGRQAMMDTMGQAAALTGGYGNSYANTAGNQAYQAYLSKVGDIVPQLQQQAFERYTQEGSDLNNRLNLVQNLENADYNRYRDSVSDWNTERSYANDDYWNQRNQDYQDYINMLNYWNQQAQQENQNYWSQQQYDTSVSQYERDLAYKQAMAILSGGKLPSADLLAKAGISDADARTLMGIYGGGGSSGGGSSRKRSGGGSSRTSASSNTSSSSNNALDKIMGVVKTAQGIAEGNAPYAYDGVNRATGGNGTSAAYNWVKTMTDLSNKVRKNYSNRTKQTK